MIKTFINIFLKVFYSLYKAINFYININLKITIEKKIIRYNLIIIYLKSVGVRKLTSSIRSFNTEVTTELCKYRGCSI